MVVFVHMESIKIVINNMMEVPFYTFVGKKHEGPNRQGSSPS